MTRSQPLTEVEAQLIEAYTAILSEPFEDKYEDRWEDEPFDRAVDEFKARAREIGFADPFELLSRFQIESFESIRAQLKKGPPMCFRPGWRSEIIGTTVDVPSLFQKCIHVKGPRLSGKERVIALDFWALWCDPCVTSGPEISDMADEYKGRVAFVGINNESIFGDTKPPNLDALNEFLEEEREGFRYTIFADNSEGFAKETVYNPAGYRGIPCVVLVADGIAVYVGSPQDTFRPVLENVLAEVARTPQREE
ncbi:hypothetical protein BGW38_008663 [Lunasporangiospora selenospora]|uniref:Thioredoxin domain-containing protein n=1 Tax=Lunasporangiospora selenospora TaxID=979761 RepID=A0A9P6KG74_9FUNG|nr:hypothetical protein BGW38_008663 [Lunasporangiospora selenospora]